MKKDEILNASRKEHRNKDGLMEAEIVNNASRVGALVCCLSFAVIFCACSYDDLQSVGLYTSALWQHNG